MKWHWLWRGYRARKDAEFREELEFHLEEDAADRESQGSPATEARMAARRELGNLTLLQEETRTLWTWRFGEELLQDVRYALRMIAANRMFSALAILSLGLGIGANTAIFSFMDAILMRSLPVANPERLVALRWHTQRDEVHGIDRHDDDYTDPKGGYTSGTFAYQALEMLRNNPSVFSSVCGYQGAGDLHVAIGNDAEIANTEYLTGEYFSTLGVPPAAGRLIGPDDDRPGAASVAVISYALSRRRFGSAGNAPGQSILINNLPFTVIGVAPREFFGADPAASPEIYVPLHASVLLEPPARYDPPAGRYADSNFEWILIMARLRPGVSTAQAQAALSPRWAQWIRTNNTERNRSDLPVLQIKDGRGGVDGLRRTYSKALYILIALVGLILALACANIANLLLARSAARRREMAVRLSIGAGRGRVIRQLLTESVVLASIGGALGLAFALWGIRVLTALVVSGREAFTPRADLNWRVLAVTAALSLATGVLFGLAPAFRSTRVDLMPALKEAQIGYPRGGRFQRLTLGRVLMVSQIGISLIILVAALLFVRTLSNLEAVQLGFNHHNVLTFKLDARQAGRGEAESLRLYESLRERFAAIPGVRMAGMSNMPLIGGGRLMSMFRVAGGKAKASYVLGAGPGFFAAMQLPILLGRAIDERDQPGAQLVAVVNQTFVNRNFGDRNPLGEQLISSHCPKCSIAIVGVSGDALHANMKGHAVPAVYLPFAQSAWGDVSGVMYELRTHGNPLGYMRTVRDLVRQADEHLPVFDVQTQSALIDRTINQEIAFARLCSAFAALALAIACVGLYGSMSYNVARRRREIGIRMALGARKGRLVWMVLREVLALTGAGLAVSVPAAFAASRLIRSFLFGTKPEDPAAYIAAAVMLAVAAVAAGYLPARSASRTDPMGALRHE